MPVEQWDFLKKSDTSLGLFYPLHYIVAGYGDIESARAAEFAFRDAGKPQEDVRAVTGGFVAKQLESREDQSWVEEAEMSLVKMVGTEMEYLNDDRKHAHDGGAFLFVYTPDEDSLVFAKRMFERQSPVYARRYLRIAIEIIINNPDRSRPGA